MVVGGFPTNILVAGVDGYIGYPLTQHLLNRDHNIYGIDCFHRRRMVRERELDSIIPIFSWKRRMEELKRLGNFEFKEYDIAIGNILNWDDTLQQTTLPTVFESFKPDVIVNLAQQPSAAYSMISPRHANFTMTNNIQGLLNLLWCMRDYTPESHMVTLGTMGEYGFPNMPIPEGFFQVEYEGMADILPFPRQTNSVYHTSKAQGSILLWFACRAWELRATEIQQGVVYGTRTDDMKRNPLRKTRFDIGECFGTMINRAVACAVMEHPVVPYGTGLQTRPYIALQDAIKCLTLAIEKVPSDDDSIHGYRVINQFDENYNCIELGEIVVDVATSEFDLNVRVENVENPRVEPEIHYYNPHHQKLYDMGWKPTRPLKEELVSMFEDLLPYKRKINKYREHILPKIKWRPEHVAIKRK